ncbi:hypothetical protein EMCG_03232 [[Emmonsia] crescens]|uniref:Protein kinase domain-containing protein n=1 Tax=[Emmonsia] crescens TaxID=73230 RepID=A0A0G2HX59_9EURO|nr:hypothetical protein EMCG_03232 [Emmonsia crescens UAMH 3008]
MTPTPPSHESELDYGDIPALLIPLSDCASHSSELPLNKKRSVKVPSSSLTKLNLPDKIGSAKAQEWKPTSSEILALKLKPSAEISYYSLGSSVDSYIVLQTVDEDECYVNYLHCQFISDPDRDSVVLYNASTSAFRAQNLDRQSPVQNVLPTNNRAFDCGSWYLELGKGLEFLLRVLPRDPELYTDLLVPCEAESIRVEVPIGHKSLYRLYPKPIDKNAPSLGRRAEKIGKIVAAKVCRKPDIQWAVLKGLKHHSVVQMLDFDGSHLTIFLEYIEGIDLSKLVDKDLISQVPEPDVYRIWKDISSALEYIHRFYFYF